GIIVPLRPGKGERRDRSDHTGSTRIFRPAVWISQLAWPTKENRTLPPSTRAGGVSEKGLGAQSGHLARLRSRPNCQRRISWGFLGGAPSGSTKCSPSKWSETGPE